MGMSPKVHRAHHPDADLAVLRKAYVLAETSHRGQMRKSGEPYITHPLAVTLILAELGAETTTLTASLLHDTVEDTDVTLDQVRGRVRRRGLLSGRRRHQAGEGRLRRRRRARDLPQDARRHRQRRPRDVDQARRPAAQHAHPRRHAPREAGRIAKVTRDVLIPLAERLGVQALKTELEDLVFAILHPDEYDAHPRPDRGARRAEPGPAHRHRRRRQQRPCARPVSAPKCSSGRGTSSPCTGCGSKRGEMRGADFGRLLVLVEEDADCYAVLGELHTCFTPVVSEFKDFIAAPKFNLYQSLHTAVAAAEGAVAEVLDPYAPDAPGRRGRRRRARQSVHPDGPPPRADEPADGRARRPDQARLALPPPGVAGAAPPTPTPSGPRCATTSRRTGRSPSSRPDGGDARPAPPAPPASTPPTRSTATAAHGCIGARVNGRLATLSTVLNDGDTVQLLLRPRTPRPAPPRSGWTTPVPRPPASPSGTGSHAHPDRRASRPRREPAPPARGPGARPADDPSGAEAGRPRRHPPWPSTLPGAPVRLARCCTPVPPDAVDRIHGPRRHRHRAPRRSVPRWPA